MRKLIDKYLNLKAFSFIRYFFYFTIIIVLLMKKDYHKLKCNINNNTFNNAIITNQQSIINFEGFNNNQIENEHYIVPNLIHYINLKQSKYTQLAAI